MTGKRHPFYVEYDVGFDTPAACTASTGPGRQLRLLAGPVGSIVDRAMFHSDNAYYLGDATINGHRCKTNTASNTAYRGFGGPQGMVAIEK
jgi:xanthine dehydrogenase large subunit